MKPLQGDKNVQLKISFYGNLLNQSLTVVATELIEMQKQWTNKLHRLVALAFVET